MPTSHTLKPRLSTQRSFFKSFCRACAPGLGATLAKLPYARAGSLADDAKALEGDWVNIGADMRRVLAGK
jgi:hypothetical protein